MQQVTHKELVGLLNEYKGVTFVSCSIESPVKMAKGGTRGREKNEYFGKITKQSYLNGAVGFNYENSVNNQREREGQEADFEAKQRAWGQLLEGGKFVEHKGAFYLQLKVENVKDESVKYLNEGVIISKDKLAEWLPKRNVGTGRQATEQEIVIRDIKLANIKTIKFGKKEYEVIA